MSEWTEKPDDEEDGYYWFSGVYMKDCEPLFVPVQVSLDPYTGIVSIAQGHFDCGCEQPQWAIDDTHWVGFWMEIKEPEPALGDTKMREHMGYVTGPGFDGEKGIDGIL